MPAYSRTDDEVGVTQLSGVELRMAADPTQLSIVRAVAADIAMRQDFDLDSIEDLKLAVNETCSELITLAAQDAVLSCQFAVDGGAVRVSAQVAAKSSDAPDQESFAWRVLSALVDSVQADVDTGSEGFVVRVELVKSSAGAVDW